MHASLQNHNDVIKWKHFPRYWPFTLWGESTPLQRTVTRSFDVFFDLRQNKRLSKTRDAGPFRRHRAHRNFTVMVHSEMTENINKPTSLNEQNKPLKHTKHWVRSPWGCKQTIRNVHKEAMTLSDEKFCNDHNTKCVTVFTFKQKFAIKPVRNNTTIYTTFFIFIRTSISATSYMDNPGYENMLCVQSLLQILICFNLCG